MVLVTGRAPDRVIRWFATLALLVVGGISAAGSFTHIQRMAAGHGQDGWVSWAIAVSMELVVGMAALEILRDSRAGRHAGMPWLILLSGAALVLATNLATAERSPWGWILAGWPAVASMSATKLFVRRLRHAAEDVERPRTGVLPPYRRATATVPRRQPLIPLRAVPLLAPDHLRRGTGTRHSVRHDIPRAASAHAVTARRTRHAPRKRPSSNRATPVGNKRHVRSGAARQVGLAELRERGRRLYAQSLSRGTPMTGDEIGAACGLGARWGRQRIKEVRGGMGLRTKRSDATAAGSGRDGVSPASSDTS